MSRTKTAIIALFSLISATTIYAQTAADIVAKHVDAIGGKDKLAQVKSVYIESSTEVMGNQAATKTYIINGKNYRNESDFGGQTMVQVMSDKSGWAIVPFNGSTDPVEMPDADFKAGSDVVHSPDPLINLTANGGKVELLGQEKVNNANAYKLKYTNKHGSDITYYIDATTYYIIQSSRQGNAMGQAVTINTTYSNFKKTDFGIFLPHTTDIDMGQFALTVNTQKVEINKEIDPKLFELPKK